MADKYLISHKQSLVYNAAPVFTGAFSLPLFNYMGAILQDLKLTEVGGSATEIVSVAELKIYLQIEGAAYDGPLGIFITAARQMIEQRCGVSLMEKTAIAVINNNSTKPFKLPYYPVTAISEVKWKKCPSEWVVLVADEDYSTLGNSNVEIDSSDIGIHQVTYTLGVDERQIFVQAVKAQAGYMFNNRDADKMVTMAPEVNALLQTSFFIG